jgi:UDP-N-acetylglucosamine 2-epimerase (non-hydrolysing)
VIIKSRTVYLLTVAIVTGTRPEIIKMYPIIRQFDSRSIDYKYIHTGQHYDYNLFLKFIQEFGIRKPDISIAADISNPVKQVVGIMEKLGIVINQIKPSLVLIEGDTNSVLASALSALKSNIPIAHVESGLRSYDWRTVEEHNRRIVDHISDILFSPTDISTKNLKNENVQGEIYTVGNTAIDAINLCLTNEKIKNNNNTGNEMPDLSGIDQQKDDFILVTMHRSENVDDMTILKEILVALSESSQKYIFPMHPHTKKRIQEYGLFKYIGKGIKIREPVGYLDFLKLLRKCKFVVTDSGGIQEEITSPRINKRALVLRNYTERPESVNSNHSILCKIDRKTIFEQIQTLESNSSRVKRSSITSPYGTGLTAVKITNIIEKKFC